MEGYFDDGSKVDNESKVACAFDETIDLEKIKVATNNRVLQSFNDVC